MNSRLPFHPEPDLAIKKMMKLVTELREEIISRIYIIRGRKVMVDNDLARIYGVTTARLNQQVRRNVDRFPVDFMFELTIREFENLRSNFGTSSWGGIRYPPMVFTEQGVAMLSSVLNSERAILVNIRIIRIFTRMREMLVSNRDILEKLRNIESTVSDHDEKIMLIFEYLKQLEQVKQQELLIKERPRIGFKREDT